MMTSPSTPPKRKKGKIKNLRRTNGGVICISRNNTSCQRFEVVVIKMLFEMEDYLVDWLRLLTVQYDARRNQSPQRFGICTCVSLAA
jgi:hypothetical protein